jgi:uncharacterized protein YdeI (YjbR/CyaY-like superfamily)
MKPQYFKTAVEFRAWLEKHHADTPELWVGFYKKGSGKGGISYQDGVDAALCYGWIDGIKKRVDEHSYTHRFSPRRKRSIWSLVNTRRITQLIKEKLVAEPGLRAFNERDDKRSGVYSFEQRQQPLAPKYEKLFKANKAAWAFFRAQPPGYQKLATFFIMSAKKEETQRKRLQTVIDKSASGTRLQ